MSGGLAYRQEVDGLRAIAVVPVVLYHAGVPGLGGGFVGVDVFFVISGYLITGLLCRELESTGRLSMAGFFERRVRRLAPALLLVLAATLLLSLAYLSPIGGEQQGLARSAIAALALSANLYFWRFTGGYFDDPAEGQPLLHLWSLAVEEQFYLVWPWLLLALYGLARRRAWAWDRALVWALWAVVAVSLVLCIALSQRDPQAAFYLMPARAWELAAGALAFVFVEKRLRLAPGVPGGLALLGLAGIAAAVAGFDRSLNYPGAWALVPVLSTVAVLVGTAASPQGVVTRLLSLRPLVAIGLVSYAWYLWHWPLLVMARAEGLGHLRGEVAWSMVVLSLALAGLTYRYLEVPIRARRFRAMADRRGAWRMAAAGCALVLVLAAALGIWAKWAWHWLPGHAPLAQAMMEMRKVRVACGASAPYAGPLSADAACDRGLSASGAGPRLVVWGDSHAAHLVPLLEAYAAQAGSSFRVRYMPQCPPAIGFSPSSIGLKGVQGCAEFNRDVLQEVLRLHAAGVLRGVVLNARWTGYGSTPAGLQGVEQGLGLTLQALDHAGVKAVLVLPSPDMPFEVPACLVRRPSAACDLQRQDGERKRAVVLQAMQSQPGSPRVRTFDPFTALCTSETCPAMLDDMVAYSDSHHLSHSGSRVLLRAALPALQWMSGDATEPR